MATTTFGDGATQVRQLPGSFQSQALGFDEDGAFGTDRSYLVAEIPQVGWHPTTGTQIGAQTVLGVLPVLFGAAGEIAEDVDFGNLIVVNLDMGPDLTVNEGGLATVTPVISDPLGRSNAFTYLWLAESSNGQVVAGGTGANFSFTPYDNGTYTLRLFVTDTERGFAAQPGTVTVTALNVAPSFEAGADRAIDEGALLALDLPFTDPGRNDTHSALINWGDGTSIALASLPETTGSGSIAAGHAYADNGAYTVTVTLTDDDAASKVDSFVVTVANAAPVVNAGPGKTVNEGAAVNLAGVTFTDGGTSDTHAATVDWGDGSVEPLAVVETPSGPPGSTSGLLGTLSGSHVYGDNGTYTVTLGVTDKDGASGTGTLLVTVLNVAPVGADDTYSLLEDHALQIAAPGVLGNDTDVPADVLSSVVATGPAGGSLTLNPDGSFTYTPNLDFNGSDSFTYAVSDDDGGVSAPVTVFLSVAAVNDAPSFTKGADPVADEDAGPQSLAGWASAVSAGPADEAGQALTFVVQTDNQALFATLPAISADGTLTFTSAPNAFGSANVTVRLMDDGGTANGGADTSAAQAFNIHIASVNDAPVAQNASVSTDEDTLREGTLGASDVEGDALSFSLVDAAAHGLVEVLPDGSYSYLPSANYFGDDSFTFKANDGTDDSSIATVLIKVNPVNDAPVAQDASVSTNEDTLLEGTLGATDVEDDALSFSLVGAAAHGVAEVLPSGLFRYTPAANYAGTDSFTFRASDASASSLVATVTIAVNPRNDAPVLGAIGDKAVNEQAELTFTATATDADLPANNLSFSLVGAPEGATIGAGTGVFSWTPTEAQGPGVYSFAVRVTDDGDPSLFDEETISVAVSEVNVAPVLDAIGNRTVDEGTLLELHGDGERCRPAGQRPHLQPAGGAGRCGDHAATGVFSWTPSEAQGAGQLRLHRGA